MTLTIRVPAALWLSSNRPVTNHAHRARIIRDLHTLTRDAYGPTLPAHIPGPVAAHWQIRYPKGVSRKADPPNAYPTTKAILDAIVNDGILRDDSADVIVSHTYRRGANLTETGWHEVQLTLVSQEVPW